MVESLSKQNPKEFNHLNVSFHFASIAYEIFVSQRFVHEHMFHSDIYGFICEYVMCINYASGIRYVELYLEIQKIVIVGKENIDV
jgi:hypothetical protein